MSASAAPRERLDRWLANHHGVVTRPALLAMGFSDPAVRHLINSRSWEAVLPGVYRSPAYPTTRVQMLTAICLYNSDATIAFTTAGQELGIRKMSDPRIHVLVPHGSGLSIPDVEIHRCRRIDPVDIAFTRSDGVRLTSPPRTLFDSAAILGANALESAIEQALRDELCSFDLLMRTDERLFHPRRPGALRFRTVMVARPAWRGSARSDLEVRVRQAIARRGLPEPAINATVEVAPGEAYEVDLSWARWQVAVEVDHHYWHDGSAEVRRDRRRDRRLGTIGWNTTRLDEHEIDTDLDGALDDVVAILSDRGWTPRAAA